MGLITIPRTPESAPVKHKTIYTSSGDDLRRISLGGVTVEIQGSAIEELEYATGMSFSSRSCDLSSSAQS
jgi:hypothetical protein